MNPPNYPWLPQFLQLCSTGVDLTAELPSARRCPAASGAGRSAVPTRRPGRAALSPGLRAPKRRPGPGDAMGGVVAMGHG